MTTALNTVNLSDVPLVNPADLARPMQYMIDTGRGLAMLRGISKAELREVDHALWDELDPAQRVAVLMRFRCLVRVFGARRLADLLMHTGHNLIALKRKLPIDWIFGWTHNTLVPHAKLMRSIELFYTKVLPRAG